MSKKQFVEDVVNGLTAKAKYLPSKYFYDKKGDKLFQEIMGLSEYYVTDVEFENLYNHKELLASIFSDNNSSFNLIELGAGDGLKTKILIRHFIEADITFKYLPVDISASILNELKHDLKHSLPGLEVIPYQGDYFKAIARLHKKEEGRKIMLFLGSSVGNFPGDASIKFFQGLRSFMGNNDLLLVGFDLMKDPHTILNAYNDKDGITARFNLNLLERINRELGADFILDNFYHYPIYHPHSGQALSFLISKIAQNVYIRDVGLTVKFKMGEAVFMEVSQKYNENLIEQLADQSGFKVIENLYDSKKYFVNSLWSTK